MRDWREIVSAVSKILFFDTLSSSPTICASGLFGRWIMKPFLLAWCDEFVPDAGSELPRTVKSCAIDTVPDLGCDKRRLLSVFVWLKFFEIAFFSLALAT